MSFAPLRPLRLMTKSHGETRRHYTIFTKSPPSGFPFLRFHTPVRPSLSPPLPISPTKDAHFFRPSPPVRPSRLFQSKESTAFMTVDFVLNSSRSSAVRPSLAYRGAAIAVRRRPRCIAVRAPLRPREGLTARPRPPLQKTEEAIMFITYCQSRCCSPCKCSSPKAPDF